MITNALYDEDVMIENDFQAPKFVNDVPEGYMTSDDFWKRVDNNIAKRCKEYGLL